MAIKPFRARWNPQPDITAYELALALPLLMSTLWDQQRQAFDMLPATVQRHFEVKS